MIFINDMTIYLPFPPNLFFVDCSPVQGPEIHHLADLTLDDASSVALVRVVLANLRITTLGLKSMLIGGADR
jgi:hypothetical protein